MNKLAAWLGRAVLATALVTLGSTAARANLITNGDFENPNIADGTFVTVVAGNPGLTGWIVGGVNILLIDSAYSESGNTIVFNSYSAWQAVDITGVGGPEAGNSGANSIEQWISTTVGTTYLLEFYLGNAQRSGGVLAPYAGSSSVTFTALNSDSTTVVASTGFTNAATTPGWVNWVQQSYSFVAQDTTTLIRFTNATLSGDNYVGIDKVSVNAVPEPVSVGLIGVGLLGLALVRRRTGIR